MALYDRFVSYLLLFGCSYSSSDSVLENSSIEDLVYNLLNYKTYIVYYYGLMPGDYVLEDNKLFYNV